MMFCVQSAFSFKSIKESENLQRRPDVLWWMLTGSEDDDDDDDDFIVSVLLQAKSGTKLLFSLRLMYFIFGLCYKYIQ